jgi:hypothetical protein
MALTLRSEYTRYNFMKNCRQVERLLTTAAAFVLLFCTSAQAGLVAVPEAGFGPPEVTFSEVGSDTPLNGLTINGFGFSETMANTFVADGGPGDTNNAWPGVRLRFRVCGP